MAKKQTKKAPPKHSAAFQQRALEQWEKLRAEGKGGNEAAKAVGVTAGMLYYWQSKRDNKPWGKRPPPALNGKGARPAAMVVRSAPAAETVDQAEERTRALRKDSAAAEVIRLKAENALLREECKVLTDTVMVFARRRT